MKIVVNWEDGEKLQALFNGHSVLSDASLKNGGREEYPEPADYLFASMALCAGFYLRKFFIQRNIDVSNCRLEAETANCGDGYKRAITFNVSLPPDFPEKYRPALQKVLDGCAVKKIIEAGPDFNYIIN